MIELPFDAAQARDAQRVPPREEILNGGSVGGLAASEAQGVEVCQRATAAFACQDRDMGSAYYEIHGRGPPACSSSTART